MFDPSEMLAAGSEVVQNYIDIDADSAKSIADHVFEVMFHKYLEQALMQDPECREKLLGALFAGVRSAIANVGMDDCPPSAENSGTHLH